MLPSTDYAAFGVVGWGCVCRAPRLSRAGNSDRRTMNSMQRMEAWLLRNAGLTSGLSALLVTALGSWTLIDENPNRPIPTSVALALGIGVICGGVTYSTLRSRRPD